MIPTRAGRDIQNQDNTVDGHIRIETYKKIGTEIYVDLFDSAIEDPTDAHIESQSFDHTDEGARDATEFLQGKGFSVVVMIK